MKEVASFGSLHQSFASLLYVIMLSNWPLFMDAAGDVKDVVLARLFFYSFKVPVRPSRETRPRGLPCRPPILGLLDRPSLLSTDLSMVLAPGPAEIARSMSCRLLIDCNGWHVQLSVRPHQVCFRPFILAGGCTTALELPSISCNFTHGAPRPRCADA